MLYILIRAFVGVMSVVYRLLYNVTFEGIDNIPEKGPFIVSSNEIGKMGNMLISFVVSKLVLGGLMEQPVGFLDEYSLTTQYGALFRRFGTQPLFPHGRGQAAAGLLRALHTLREGKSVAMNPEAQISWDGRLVPLTRGVAWLALRSGAPIVLILATKGAYDVWPAWADRPQLTGRFRVRIGEPIYLGDGPCARLTTEMIDLANRRLAQEMVDLIYH
jgi:1-acyl-sn-glycerol-3-phosphate acyltransferase